MPKGFPRSLSSLFKHAKKTPARVDAATTFTDGQTYLFAGDEYYRLMGNKLLVAPGYPKRIVDFWLDCSMYSS